MTLLVRPGTESRQKFRRSIYFEYKRGIITRAVRMDIRGPRDSEHLILWLRAISLSRRRYWLMTVEAG